MPVAKTIVQQNFTRGWCPSHDAEKAPPGSYLRGINLVLDDLGVPVLRGPLDNIDQLGEGPVLRIFDHFKDSDRFRVVHSGGEVFVNGSNVAKAGDRPAAIGSMFGKAFICSSEGNKVFDPNTSSARTLGLLKPTAAPGLAGISGVKLTLALCDATDSPAGTFIESTIGSETSKPGHDNVAGSALIAATSTQLRGVYQRIFASVTNLSGIPEDIVQLYVFVQEPKLLKSISLAIDCGSSADPLVLFAEDYFSYDFISGQDQVVALPEGTSALEDAPEAEFDDRRRIIFRKEERRTKQVNFSSNNLQAGWNKLQVPRGGMSRIGNTPGRGWSTCQAVKVSITLQPSDITGAVTTNIVGVDDIQIIAGPGGFSGKYFAIFSRAFMDTDNLYETESGLSPISAAAEVDKGTLLVSGLSGGDYRKVYISGGLLDGFYFAGNAFGSSFTADTSDLDLLIADIKPPLARLIDPPEGIIDIVGPFKDRLFYVAEDYIYPSQRNQPETFCFRIRVGDTSQKTLFAVPAFNGVTIGTNKTLHRLSGDGDELPDKTVSFRLEDLNESDPPVCNAVFVDEGGSKLVYMAGNSPRVSTGSGSTPLRGDTDLLWKDQPRYGVNGFQPTFQYAAIAIAHNVVTFLPGIGSGRLIRYDQRLDRWYLHTYANPQDGFSTLYRDRDGILVAGGFDGSINVVDSLTGHELVEVDLLLPILDDGSPGTMKDPFDFQLNCATNGRRVTVDFFINRSDEKVARFKANGATNGDSVPSFTQLDRLPAFRQIQVAMSGKFRQFRLQNYALSYRPRPELATFRDTGYVHTKAKEFEWVHEIYVGIKPSLKPVGSGASGLYFFVSIYFDGALFQVSDSIQLIEDVTEYRVPVNRGGSGRMFRVTVSSIPPPVIPEDNARYSLHDFQFLEQLNGNLSDINMLTALSGGFNVAIDTQEEVAAEVIKLVEASPIDVYYIEFRLRSSGKATEKQVLRVEFP